MNERITSVNTVANIVQLAADALKAIPNDYIELPPTDQMMEHIQALVAKRLGGYRD